MDKKTIAIIVLSAIIVIFAGIYIYQEIRLAETPNELSQLRKDNERLLNSNKRLVESVEQLNRIRENNKSKIARLELNNSELKTELERREIIITGLNTRIDRLTSNYESTIPIYNEVRNIFEYYAEENK